jgi:hypothetical protein
MLRWALDLFLERGDHSWSVENVSTPTTRKVLEEYRTRFPDRVALATLCASDFGSCQTRIRLIAAPPLLIKRLQEMPAAKRQSVREAFTQHGLLVPAPCFKNQTMSRSGAPCVRNVEQQSHTVCASHPLTWTSSDGRTVRVMSPRESAILMGFPQTWRLPKGSRVGQRAVGNALCVAMSKAIVEAALSIAIGVQMPTTLTQVAVEAAAVTVADEAAEEASARPNKRARFSTPAEQAPTGAPSRSSAVQRLRSIEVLVKELLRDKEEGGEAGECEHEIDQNRMFDCGCGTNDSYCIKCGEPMQCPECAA